MKDWRKALAFWLFVVLASSGSVYFIVMTLLQGGSSQQPQATAVAPPPAPAPVTQQPATAQEKKPAARPAPVLDTTPARRPDAAVSAIRITLRNGKSIVADICRDQSGKLVCEKGDGSFEIEKQDVVEIREVKVAPDVREQFVLPQTEKAGEAQRAEAAKAGPAAASPEQNKQLDELEKRRAELTAEGEQISREREKLRADIQALGITKSRTTADEYQQRINALDERIRKHNEQVDELNRQINSLSAPPAPSK